MNDEQLDLAISGYYRRVDVDVPPKLHGRVVRSIEERGGSAPGWRRLSMAFLGGGATVAGAALALVLVVNTLMVASPSVGPASPVVPPATTTVASMLAPTAAAASAEPAEPTPLPLPIDGLPMAQARYEGGGNLSASVSFATDGPTLDQPGNPDAGPAIQNDLTITVMGARIQDFWETWRSPDGQQVMAAAGVSHVSIHASAWVYAYARSATDTASSFVTLVVTYDCQAPYATSGPQYYDIVSYDLRTGARISIADLFTNSSEALDRLSRTAAADPGLAAMGPALPEYYAPTAANFAMWMPTADGLRVTFAAATVVPAAYGHPSIVVPWSSLRDLIAPDSYLGWYLAAAK